MKKYLFGVICIAISLVIIVSVAASEVGEYTAHESFSRVRYAGYYVKFQDAKGNPLPLLEYNDSVYVPVRSFANWIGKTVDWEEVENEITVSDEKPKLDLDTLGKYDNRHDEIVSMMDLMGNPEKYENQIVMTTGFINIGFEVDMLYLTKEDYEYGGRNYMRLSLRQPNKGLFIEDLDAYTEYSGHFVELQGVFHYDRGGYFTDINYINVQDSFRKAK